MLTTKQYKFLKKLLKNDITCEGLHQNRDDVYVYLLKRGFISTYNVSPSGDIMERDSILYCKLTEEGKVELILCKQSWYHFWIPTIISIIALGISLIPAVCSYVQTILCQSAS